MPKRKKLYIVLFITLSAILFLLHHPSSSTKKVYSPDKQYSVFSTFNNGRYYERFIPVMSGDGSNISNCKVIVYDEIENKVIVETYCMEGEFYPYSSEIEYEENQVVIYGNKVIKLPRPIGKTSIKDLKEEQYSKLIFKLGENNEISIKQDRLSSIKLPQKLISSLILSFDECDFCYNKFKKDTTITISYVENALLYPFQLIDLNFDGFVDIGFPSNSTCCSGNNVINEIWIFDKSKNTFVYNTILSEMPIWNLKTEDKTIESGWHMGANDFGKYVYKWEGDSLTITEEFNSESINDSLIREVTKKLRGIEWEIDTVERHY